MNMNYSFRSESARRVNLNPQLASNTLLRWQDDVHRLCDQIGCTVGEMLVKYDNHCYVIEQAGDTPCDFVAYLQRCVEKMPGSDGGDDTPPPSDFSEQSEIEASIDLTVRVVESIIEMSRALMTRDLTPDAVQNSLKTLGADSDFKRLIDVVSRH